MRWGYRNSLVKLWPMAFLLAGTSWLWAPQLNHFLSYRTTLISQFEAPGQPYGWLFRLGDIVAALLLISAALALKRTEQLGKIQQTLLLIIGFGMLIDPTFASNCRWDQAGCHQHLSISFAIHALETTITASAILAIAIFDSWLRKRLVSIGFVLFQVLYGMLLLSQLATHNHFNTISQYIYQLASLLWLSWYVYGYLEKHLAEQNRTAKPLLIRNSIAIWAFLNGVAAIVISLAHLHLFGEVRGLYFAGDNAWLAQHGVIIGVAMIYLSRQLRRGERRARQIFMSICSLEVIKYSLITPHPLMAVYILTFVVLFMVKDQFDRGTIVLTWHSRLKEAAFITTSLSAVAALALILLDLDNQRALVAAQALDNFFDYSLGSKVVPKSHLSGVLLAHTISIFLIAGLAAILWILFRPYKTISHKKRSNEDKVRQLLFKYSTIPDDYFKLWPNDKNYFWDSKKRGFIAYKIVGSIAFALADPISTINSRALIIEEFIAYNRAHRLRVCFLPIYQTSLPLYEQAKLNVLRIGASALIDIEKFTKNTANDKWWRWQKNRAEKQGYNHQISLPPHPKNFISQLRKVSDSWLKKGGHQERGFAMGYFETNYLAQCPVHYLTDNAGQIVAFTNQLPNFKSMQVISIDLLRYRAEANNAMPYLLLKMIENLKEQGVYKYFDLGFVPFTSSRGPAVALARLLSTGRFSAHGLEQFKNKFDPDWQPNYLAHEGDLADLALIATNLETVMENS